MHQELFDSARAHLTAHRRAAGELKQRCEQVPLCDRNRKAIQRVIRTRWLDEFVSRADDCAHNCACFSQPQDVFYGISLANNADVIAQVHPSIRKGLTTSDCHLLTTAVQQAILFMRAVRTLPGFQLSWAEELNKCENAKAQHASPNLQHLLDQKLNPTELYTLVLILSRRTGFACTRSVLSFLCP